MGAHLQRGLLLFSQQRLEQAEQELRQELGEEPDSPVAHAVLGLCLARQKRLEDALAETSTAIVLGPDLAYIHFAHADVLHDSGRLDDAVSAIRESIRLDPSDPDYRALLANILLDRRDWQGALESADSGLALDAEHIGCTNLRAMALTRLGRFDEAEQSLVGALERNPEDAVSHANQGWALLHRAEYTAALESFRESLRLQPGLELARRGLVEALKARYRLYGLLLRYFLWIGRLSGGKQWLVIIGGALGFRALGGVASLTPATQLLFAPVALVYVLFVLSTWIGVPVFNLLLRLNRFGRLALSREETVASNWVGGCLGLSLVLLIVAIAVGSWVPAGLAAVAGLATVPVAAAFQCESGWPRLAMGAYAAAIVTAGATGVITTSLLPAGSPLRPVFGEPLLMVGVFGLLLTGIVGNVLVSVRPRRTR
ncbi:MAG: tetratricopeptide repeat protein [Chloroflexota bacterium]